MMLVLFNLTGTFGVSAQRQALADDTKLGSLVVDGCEVDHKNALGRVIDPTHSALLSRCR